MHAPHHTRGDCPNERFRYNTQKVDRISLIPSFIRSYQCQLRLEMQHARLPLDEEHHLIMHSKGHKGHHEAAGPKAEDSLETRDARGSPHIDGRRVGKAQHDFW